MEMFTTTTAASPMAPDWLLSLSSCGPVCLQLKQLNWQLICTPRGSIYVSRSPSLPMKLWAYLRVVVVVANRQPLSDGHHCDVRVFVLLLSSFLSLLYLFSITRTALTCPLWCRRKANSSVWWPTISWTFIVVVTTNCSHPASLLGFRGDTRYHPRSQIYLTLTPKWSY